MLRFILSVLSVSLLSAFSVQAEEVTTNTVVEKRVIVSPAPKAVCSSVAGHWEGNIWVDTHSICKYENRVEGVAWIESYWSCTVAAADGTCTTWELVPGHWVKTLQ